MANQIQLKISILRKQQGITQQQLAEVVGTSFQTISKWENGVTMPDITVLPVLASYFKVTVDELLGLVPLKEESYLSEKTDTEAFWDKRLEYLRRTRQESWNPDYFEFLVKNVWKLNRPVSVLDCGCGYGYMGEMLMPVLPEKSEYTGIDFSDRLLDYGKRFLEKKGIQGRFINEDILNMEEEEKYDVVLCQSVLRHVGDSRPIIRKMIELAKEGGLLICIDTNRELECAGLYVDGMDYFDLCNHAGVEKHWRAEIENGDRDYAAAMRNAYVMRELGVEGVEIRMNDKVSFVCPEIRDYEQKVKDFVCQNELWYDNREKTLEILVNHGMKRDEAQKYVDKPQKIREYFEKHQGEVAYTLFKGKTITFGTKRKT